MKIYGYIVPDYDEEEQIDKIKRECLERGHGEVEIFDNVIQNLLDKAEEGDIIITQYLSGSIEDLITEEVLRKIIFICISLERMNFYNYSKKKKIKAYGYINSEHPKEGQIDTIKEECLERRLEYVETYEDDNMEKLLDRVEKSDVIITPYSGKFKSDDVISGTSNFILNVESKEARLVVLELQRDIFLCTLIECAL